MGHDRYFRQRAALPFAATGLAASLVILAGSLRPGKFPLPLLPEPAMVLSLLSALCAAFDVLECAGASGARIGRRLAGWLVLQLSAVTLGWSLAGLLADAFKLMH